MAASSSRLVDAEALGALGISPASPVELAGQRAHGVLHHLVTLVSLGRETGMSVQALADWNLTQASAHGYHEEWIRMHGSGNVDAFLRDFISGRRMLYDDSAVYRIDGGYEVHTPLWFYDEPPEIFFYYDLSAEEFSAYVIALGVENARRCGVRLDLRHDGAVEIAQMRKDVL